MKQKEKRGIIRLFPICVLLIILGAALNFWGGEKNPLLEKSGVQTLYLTIAPGEELNLRASEYFEEGILDENRISYDTSRCNTKQPGTYVVPIFYDGEETNCIFQVTVEENGKSPQILQKPGMDKNTEEIRICE